MIFYAFVCEDNFEPSGTVSFLRADFSTDCNGEEYRHLILPWAIASLVLYPVGVNLMYGVVLFRNRVAIQKGGADDIAFIHYAYAPHAWFFEPVDSFRRISLTGLLVWIDSDGVRVVAAMFLSFGWLALYYRFAPFVSYDDQLLAELVNADIVFTTMLLSCKQGELVDNQTVVVLCVTMNFVIIPCVALLQLRHAWRGWHVVKSLEPGCEIRESFEVAWFMRVWDAGGYAREFLRNRTIGWLKFALLASPVDVDDAICHSILRVLQLPPFQQQGIEHVGSDGMGVVLEMNDGPCFALLVPDQASGEERGRSTFRGASSFRVTSGDQPLLAIDMRQPLESNARLTFANAVRRDLDVRYTPGSYFVEIIESQRVMFESVLLYAIQTLVEKGRIRFLLDCEANGWWPLEYPVHCIMQSQLMTSRLLSKIVVEAEPTSLVKQDDAERNPFHYLRYRAGDASDRPHMRTDDAIADLIFGVAEAHSSLVQILLQQAAAHAFVSASRRLIEECKGQIDEPSALDPRTPRKIGKDAHDAAARAFFDDRDDEQQRALEEQASFFERKVLETRCKLFRESLLGGPNVVEPWGLGKGELQAYLYEKLDVKKGSLKYLVDAMGEVDGLMVLSSWVKVGFDSKGNPNFGKLECGCVNEQCQIAVKKATIVELGVLLGVLNKGQRSRTGVQRMGGLSYHIAILHSCESRSLLTDYDWVKMVGEGAFGRAHLCRYDLTNVADLCFVCCR